MILQSHLQKGLPAMAERLLIGLVNRVQDFRRVEENPAIYEYIGTAADFRAELGVVSDWADVRKIKMDQSDTVSKGANPSKFKDERKWPEWEPAFEIYLSTIPGVNGVPLSYLIWLEETPATDQTYESFNKKAIACAPLTGPQYQADSRKVHQLLKSFLQSESAE